MSEALDQLLVPSSRPSDERIYDHYLGSLLGGAIADALGWITEFRKSKAELANLGLERVEDFITWEKPTGGRFHTYIDYVSRGDYSDDTQLLLCTARSMRPDGSFDAEYFAEELAAWLDYARGAGAAISAAARNLRSYSVHWYDNFYGAKGRSGRRGYCEAGGNGAAMRVAPHGLANRHDPKNTADGVWENSIITHGHPRAHVGALVMAEAVRVAANVESITQLEFAKRLDEYIGDIEVPEGEVFTHWLRRWDSTAGRSYKSGLDETKREMRDMLRIGSDASLDLKTVLERLGCYRQATKGSGTGCVAAAIATFIREPVNYEQQVLAIINELGIDTDTIGAMYGALAGARLGSTRIPDRWSSGMQDYDYFLAVADALTQIAIRQAKSNYLRVDIPLIREREKDIVELTRRRIVSKGQRVLHDVLGPGWVQAANSTTVKSGGRMLLADVAFDAGQSARFKSSTDSQGNPREPRRRTPSGKTPRLDGPQGLML